VTRPIIGRVAPEQRRTTGAPASTREPGTARIAVDLLGGDGTPAVVVDGALHALHLDPALRLLLVGPPSVLDGALAALADRAGSGLSDRVDRLDCGTNGTGTIRTAVRAVRDGRADAVVSAGSTASSVAAAVSGFGRLSGVSRPALAAMIPAAAGPVILLDVGASPDVAAEDLLRHAVLGASYATAMLGPSPGGSGWPRVGLLSIGTEPGKGDRLRRDAGARLAGTALPDGGWYVGMVEGHHVALGGPADVVVTDGFTGNVVLKTSEGASQVLFELIREEIMRTAGGKLGALLLRGAFRRLKRTLDVDEYGGAPLVGVDGVAILCHGRANAKALKNGIRVAASFAEAALPAAVSQAIAKHAALWPPDAAQASGS
jgi:glycerol-3-phosphate acyltransferase PlsX